MPTTDEASPFDATATTTPSPDDTGLPVTLGPAPIAEPDASSHDGLSPAVRRLVRQFDLDITGIHGSGPEGRIRVGDLINLLGGRTDSGIRDAPRLFSEPDDSIDDTIIDPIGEEDADSFAKIVEAQVAPAAAPAAVAAVPTTTVFDCDLSRVLSHRKKRRRDNVEVLLTSYFVAAFAEALEVVPELAASSAARFGVLLAAVDGEPRSLLLDASPVSTGTPLDERLRAIDAALRASVDADLATATVLVHHYSESGSLLATPTPIGPGHAGSLGIGRVRREIGVRTIDGVETPRVAARCYLGLSFHTDRVAFHRANRFMAHATRVLEQWPE